MKKITRYYYLTLFFVLSAVPAPVWANINTIYDAKEKIRQMKDTLNTSSPVYGMVLYSLGAVGIFIGLIMVVFLLIMFLKR